MEELSGGLWTWTGTHPTWTPEEAWGPDVRSYGLRNAEGIILFDPITPPSELLNHGKVEIVLTAAWHERSAAALNAPIHGVDDPLTDGVNAQPAFFPGERSLWLLAHNALIVGDSLPAGGPAPDDWLGEATREEYNARLRPLLDLPIELLLPTHGEPITDDARGKLRAALS